MSLLTSVGDYTVHNHRKASNALQCIRS